MNAERPLARIVAFNASAQLAAFVVSAVAGLVALAATVRYLGVDDYGLFVTATTFVSLLQLVSDFGMEPVSVRMLVREPERRPRILTTVLVTGSATNLTAGFIAVGLGAAIYSGQPDLIGAILILSVQTLGGGLRLAGSATANSRQRAPILSLSNALARLVTLAMTFGVIGADLGFVAIVAVQAAYLPLRAIIQVAFLRSDFRGLESTSREACAELLRQAAPVSVLTILSAIYMRLDLLMLSLLRDAADVAVYGLAYKIVDVLMVLPSFVLITVLPVLAREDGETERFSTVLGHGILLMQALAVGLLCLALGSSQVMSVVGGAAFEEGAVLALLLASQSVFFVQSALGYGVFALGQQSRMLRVSVPTVLFNLVLNFVLIPPYGAVGAAAAMLASSVLNLLLTARLFETVRLAALLPSPRLIGAGAGAAAIFVCVLTVTERSGAGDTVGLVFALPALGASYVALIVVLRVVPTEMLRRVLRRSPDALS